MVALLDLCRRLKLLILNDEAYYGLDLHLHQPQQQPPMRTTSPMQQAMLYNFAE